MSKTRFFIKSQTVPKSYPKTRLFPLKIDRLRSFSIAYYKKCVCIFLTKSAPQITFILLLEVGELYLWACRPKKSTLRAVRNAPETPNLCKPGETQPLFFINFPKSRVQSRILLQNSKTLVVCEQKKYKIFKK